MQSLRGRLPVRVLYTFDVPLELTQRNGVPCSVFNRGNCATTMLRESIRSVLRCSRLSKVPVDIRVYTSTHDDLALLMPDLTPHISIIPLKDALASCASADHSSSSLSSSPRSLCAEACDNNSVGVENASDDSAKFAKQASGHARVYLLPHEIRLAILGGDAGVLYLDNDTLMLPSARCGGDAPPSGLCSGGVGVQQTTETDAYPAEWNEYEYQYEYEREYEREYEHEHEHGHDAGGGRRTLLDALSGATVSPSATCACLAYELEGSTCDEILGAGTAAVRQVFPGIDSVPVVNNGVLWFPANKDAMQVSNMVQEAYSRLPSSAWCRYLHDMIAVSVVWGELAFANARRDSSLPTVGFFRNLRTGQHVRGIVHYWRWKSQPHRMADFIHRVMMWRAALDEQALLHLRCDEGLSEDMKDALSAAVIEQLEIDVQDVREGCVLGGIAWSGTDVHTQATAEPGCPAHMRSNLVSMRRTRSHILQPGSARLAQLTGNMTRPSVRLASTLKLS